MSRTGFLLSKLIKEDLNSLCKGDISELDKEIAFRTKKIKYLARAERARDGKFLNFCKHFNPI